MGKGAQLDSGLDEDYDSRDEKTSDRESGVSSKRKISSRDRIVSHLTW